MKAKEKPRYLMGKDFWQAVNDCVWLGYFEVSQDPGNKGVLFKILSKLRTLSVQNGDSGIETVIVVPNLMTLARANSILKRMVGSIVQFVRDNPDLRPTVRILCNHNPIMLPDGTETQNDLGNKAIISINFTGCVRGSQRVRGRQDACLAQTA